MPFGHRRVQVGIMLREAMFANGILCNAEALHNITKKHIEDLEVMDRLKYIVKSYSYFDEGQIIRDTKCEFKTRTRPRQSVPNSWW